MRVTLQCPLPSLYVFACKNGRVVAELWSSCAEYRASCAEYRASCGRVARVLGELLGEIVKFRQLAQKRLGGHLCLGEGHCTLNLSINAIFPILILRTAEVPENYTKPPRGPKKRTSDPVLTQKHSDDA